MKEAAFEKILRGIKCKEMLLHRSKRVSTFKGEDAYDALRRSGVDDADVEPILSGLIQSNVIVKAKTGKEEDVCEVVLSKRFNKEDTYIWAKEPSARVSLFVSVLVLVLSLSLVMFQLWPRSLKRVASYAAYPVLGFVVFLLVLSVVRLVFFCVTFFSHSPGIWIFPNLFADVGFFESFVPLWEYHGIETNPRAKKAEHAK